MGFADSAVRVEIVDLVHAQNTKSAFNMCIFYDHAKLR